MPTEVRPRSQTMMMGLSLGRLPSLLFRSAAGTLRDCGTAPALKCSTLRTSRNTPSRALASLTASFTPSCRAPRLRKLGSASATAEVMTTMMSSMLVWSVKKSTVCSGNTQKMKGLNQSIIKWTQIINFQVIFTMYKLVLMRHGESQWNLENRFTGWTDVDLTETGREQARKAGELLKEKGFEFDLAFTSVLKRAIRTLWIALDAMDAMHTPTGLSWRLNERHYGALQGLNKAETAAKYGEEQVLIWRRAY